MCLIEIQQTQYMDKKYPIMRSSPQFLVYGLGVTFLFRHEKKGPHDTAQLWAIRYLTDFRQRARNGSFPSVNPVILAPPHVSPAVILMLETRSISETWFTVFLHYLG
jgi:hypothetical protein